MKKIKTKKSLFPLISITIPAMNRLIQYGNTDSIPFYNCSWKPQSEWWSNGVQRPWLGYPITVFGIFIELLYIPIINIIFKTKLIKHTCYKIIVLLAVTDMCATGNLETRIDIPILLETWSPIITWNSGFYFLSTFSLK